MPECNTQEMYIHVEPTAPVRDTPNSVRVIFFFNTGKMWRARIFVDGLIEPRDIDHSGSTDGSVLLFILCCLVGRSFFGFMTSPAHRPKALIKENTILMHWE